MTTVPDSILYTARATAVGGRDGRSKSSDGALDVQLGQPVESGGSGMGTNPEQLFAAGYAACFGSALELVGQRNSADTSTAQITIEVGLGPVGQAFGLAITIGVHLAGFDQNEAQRLVDNADEVCPYSNAIRGNVPVTLNVNTGESEAAGG